MVEKDKEITVKNDNLITKMISKIRSLFHKEKTKQHDEEEAIKSVDDQTVSKETLNDTFSQPRVDNSRLNDEKKRIFSIFNQVKRGEIKINELPGPDMILVNKLLKDEIEILNARKNDKK